MFSNPFETIIKNKDYIQIFNAIKPNDLAKYKTVANNYISNCL